MRSPFTKLYVHLVWSTWDRAPVISEDVRDRLYDAMAKRCLNLGCQALIIGGVDDHVHLLVNYHPALSISDLVKDIKGASSHLMNHEICPNGNFQWQGAYGAFSKSEHELERVITYIKSQATHHANNTLLEHEEQMDIIT